MDKILAIIKREYQTRVRSKGFIIGTILSPLLMTSLVLVPILLSRSSGNSSFRLVVLDQTSDPLFIARLNQLLTSDNAKADRYEIRYEVVSQRESLNSRQLLLNEQMREGELNGYIVLPRSIGDQEKIAYHAKNVSDFANRNRIANAVNTALTEQRLAQAGINPDQVKNLSRKVDLEIVNERGESDRGQTFILAYALLMILYITILAYGVTVMRGVVEEKQSRIIEVLLSSVKPFQLLIGKLLGIGLVGLTQYVVWAVSAVVISGFAAAQALAFGTFKLPHISLSLMTFFIVYFLLGYFLYATLYAMVGAIVSSEEDGQQAQLPVTMAIVVPMIFSSFVLRNPNSTLSIFLSLIPFFSPVLMFMRISLEQPPAWQIALSIVLMIGTILGVVWVAAKIYRVGILMYGKRPTLPELSRWLKYS